jgi:hypothetical protein
MVENIRGIQNPLTIIAIFAGLAEIAGTVALATVNRDIQPIFIWFVMGFPVLLVTAFFLTLNFNPKVLYAPSDFRTDDNFLNLLTGGRALNEDFRGLTNQIETANQKILKLAVEQIGQKNSDASAQLTALIGEQMRLLREKVESTRETAVETTIASAQSRAIVRCNNCKLIQYRTDNSLCRRCSKPVVATDDEAVVLPRSALQAEILTLLLTKNTPMGISEVARTVHQSEEWTTRAIEKLSERGLVELFAGPTGKLQVTHTDESRRG